MSNAADDATPFLFWDLSDQCDDPEAGDSGIDIDKPIWPQIFDAETLERLEANLHQERIRAACLNESP